jgi:hypothetical protein
MRGQLDPQSSMFHYFSPESRVPAEHPLRKVKKLADRALGAISAELDTLYSETGRPSIPPERLLKGQLLSAGWRRSAGRAVWAGGRKATVESSANSYSNRGQFLY